MWRVATDGAAASRRAVSATDWLRSSSSGWLPIDTAADAQRDLAAARGQIVDLSREIERLRQQLANARREHRRLQGLLARTQAAARGYAEHLDAAERRRRGSGWWPRLVGALAGRRDAPDRIHESQPEATA